MRRLSTAAFAKTAIVGLMAVGIVHYHAAPALAGQAGRPAPPKPAVEAPKPSPVDKVIDLQKSGLSEDLILRQINREHLHAELSSDDMIKLKKAGVTDRVIAAMEPEAAPAPAPAAAAAPAPTAAPAAAAVPASHEQQRRAAIDEFDWGSVRSSVSQIFGNNVDIGKGIRALLTTRVQQGGKVRVVERAKVQTVMNEQDFGASNRVRRGTNARVGQILGADVYLMGDIVAFGRDDRNRRISGSTLGFGGPLGAVSFGSSDQKAVIVINYRLVDAETSEVIDAGEARGESKRKSKSVGGWGYANGRAAGGGVDMTSSNFADTIIGEATIDACEKLAAILNEKASAIRTKQVDVEARVAAVGGGTVTLAAGSTDGINVGDQFEVFRIVSEIKDPVSGEILDLSVEKLGEMTISSVRDRIATGNYSGKAVTTKDGLARKKL